MQREEVTEYRTLSGDVLNPSDTFSKVSCFFLCSFIMSCCFLPLFLFFPLPTADSPADQAPSRVLVKNHALLAEKFPMIFFNVNSSFKSVFLAPPTGTETGSED